MLRLQLRRARWDARIHVDVTMYVFGKTHRPPVDLDAVLIN